MRVRNLFTWLQRVRRPAWRKNPFNKIPANKGRLMRDFGWWLIRRYTVYCSCLSLKIYFPWMPWIHLIAFSQSPRSTCLIKDATVNLITKLFWWKFVSFFFFPPNRQDEKPDINNCSLWVDYISVYHFSGCVQDHHQERSVISTCGSSITPSPELY